MSAYKEILRLRDWLFGPKKNSLYAVPTVFDYIQSEYNKPASYLSGYSDVMNCGSIFISYFLITPGITWPNNNKVVKEKIVFWPQTFFRWKFAPEWSFVEVKRTSSG